MAEIKLFSAIVKTKLSNEDAASEEKFSALISTRVIDRGGDYVLPNAFNPGLTQRRASGRRIPVLYDHDRNPESIIGSVSPFDSHETERGLVVSGILYTNEARGAKVYRELKRGTISEWSFGCVIEESRPRAGGGRDLIRLDLFEVSPTLLAKGIGTQTLMIASAHGAPPVALTLDEQLAPYRAQLTVVERRVARSRTR